MDSEETAYSRREPFAIIAVIVGLIAYFTSIITALNSTALVAAVAGGLLIAHGAAAFVDGSMRDRQALGRRFSPVSALIVGAALLILGLSR